MLFIISVFVYEIMTRPLATMIVFGVYIACGLFVLMVSGVNIQLVREHIIEDNRTKDKDVYRDMIIENDNFIRLISYPSLVLGWPAIFLEFKNNKSI